MNRKPVLFLIFNRPEQTFSVFQEIRKARPAQLFIAADGPRQNRIDDSERCNLTRSIVGSVDWDCDVKTLFRDTNLGCEIAVSQAITWFFESVESGIILEDDCLPDPSFFPYCEQLLDRYCDTDSVGVITGNNFQWGKEAGKASYYFSKFPHCWGWATWRRAWDCYDHSLSESLITDDAAIKSFNNIPKELPHWKRVFESLRNGQLNTWDFRWMRSVWREKFLTATPHVNLVRNIGYGVEASHTTDSKSVPKSYPISFPLSHPDSIQQHTVADARVARIHFGLSIRTRILNRLQRVASKLMLGIS